MQVGIDKYPKMNKHFEYLIAGGQDESSEYTTACLEFFGVKLWRIFWRLFNYYK